MDLVTTIALGSIIVYQGITNYIEKRKSSKIEQDLLNRLMSKDFGDYSVGSMNLDYKPSKENIKLEEEIRLQELKEERDSYPVN
jgi:hypothetical protein